jgi:Rps23 Pro-64 3,4-dihydroxylase Tpa1-like proline 4-hydroxylase
MTRDALPDFAASAVHEDGHGKVDVSQRVSAILRDAAAFRDVFLPHVREAMRERAIETIIGTGYDPESRPELQVTCSGDRAFFKPHTDSGKSVNKGRRITFVYYYQLAPDCFTGGSLLLFDASQDEQRYSTGSFTRIEPEDNSIVLFPSNAMHEVEPVRAISSALEHGRFTINGWLH